MSGRIKPSCITANGGHDLPEMTLYKNCIDCPKCKHGTMVKADDKIEQCIDCYYSRLIKEKGGAMRSTPHPL